MQKRNFFGELWARLKSETPGFFRKIIYFGIAIGGLGAAFSAIDFPEKMEWLGNLNDEMITVGLVCTAVAKLAVPSHKVDDVKYKDT